MFTINRRDFVKLGGLLGLGGVFDADALFRERTKVKSLEQTKKAVKFTRDGIDLSPLEYSRLLFELAEAGKIRARHPARRRLVCLRLLAVWLLHR